MVQDSEFAVLMVPAMLGTEFLPADTISSKNFNTGAPGVASSGRIVGALYY